jgi:hypothetical protein
MGNFQLIRKGFGKHMNKVQIKRRYHDSEVFLAATASEEKGQLVLRDENNNVVGRFERCDVIEWGILA